MKVWREIFLELALRAIRRTHYEFGTWELGQTKLSVTDFTRLNQGRGIYFAPEETVRDSISHEIILSGLWKKHPIQGEKRSYWIDREVRIEFEIENPDKYETFKKLFKNPRKNNKGFFDIDIVFKRIERKAKDGKDTFPSFIEAKRFELVNIDLKTKKLKVGRPQLGNINRDILKLKFLKEYFTEKKIELKGQQFTSFRTYILVWGLGDSKFNIQTNLVEKLQDGNYLSRKERSIKYLPIQWNKRLEVTRYLWIGLFQVD